MRKDDTNTPASTIQGIRSVSTYLADTKQVPMSFNPIRFNRKDRPEFVTALRQRVNAYFTDNNISRHANTRMKFKTGFMLALYFVPFVLLLCNVFTGFWGQMLMWFLMAGGMTGIGTCVMHDANHGSYSRNKYVNRVLGFMSNFLGAYDTNWRIQHNVLHHTYTNIDGHDGDISNPVLRFSPTQPRKSINRIQAFYAPVLYAMMTLYWTTAKDFEALSRYTKQDLVKTQNLSNAAAWAILIFNKTWYLAITLVLPMLVLAGPWWWPVVGFVMMHALCGMSLAFVFQTAHVVQETNFLPVQEQRGSVENNWMIHQLETTANFAAGSRLFSWFIGGLNYQIEHHLFPNICHVHYRKISEIVRQTAKEYNVPYQEYSTFGAALWSHFKHLHQLGKREVAPAA